MTDDRCGHCEAPPLGNKQRKAEPWQSPAVGHGTREMVNVITAGKRSKEQGESIFGKRRTVNGKRDKKS